jgi:Tol biopolymer transport system component
MFSARRLGLLICGLLLPIQPPASGQETERVSVDSSGSEANGDDYAWGGGISGNGRWVVFGGYASNLVANDTNALRDVFVRDREAGTTERVSVDSSGGQANDFSWNFEFAISADGRCVAFVSYASNLVQGDTNQDEDVFVHDRATGITERVSVDSSGGQANGGNRYVPGSSQPSISADGQIVAFTSFADNLVPGDANGVSDVFVHDRSSGVTERVSVDSSGAEANGASDGPAISANGRFVAFTSAADDLVAGDTNQTYDVFVHDRATGTTERVSVDSLGV